MISACEIYLYDTSKGVSTKYCSSNIDQTYASDLAPHLFYYKKVYFCYKVYSLKTFRYKNA